VHRGHTEAIAIEGDSDEPSRRLIPVSWAWLGLNQRPHPYQQSRAHRCATLRFPRSLPTVRGEVMRCSYIKVRTT
jgi:hypothetical protein